jgi:HEPN domain-containing protein
MTPGEMLRKEAGKWLEQAGKDLHSAELLLAGQPSRSVFHSQQAAEKAAKALLSLHQTIFRRTHNLAELGSQCVAHDPALGPLFERVAELTDYASAFRYPDAPYEPDTAEAQEALALAGQLVAEVRRRIER